MRSFASAASSSRLHKPAFTPQNGIASKQLVSAVPPNAQPVSERRKQLYELDLDEGWSVDAPASKPKTADDESWSVSVPTKAKQSKKQPLPTKSPKGSPKARSATPYLSMQSTEGAIALSMLKDKLSSETLDKQGIAEIRQTSQKSQKKRSKMPPLILGSEGRKALAASRPKEYEDDMYYEEEEDEELVDTPEFQISFENDGRTEVIDFTEGKGVKVSSKKVDDDEDGWGQFGDDEEEEEGEDDDEDDVVNKKRSVAEVATKLEMYDNVDQDWGLEELEDTTSLSRTIGIQKGGKDIGSAVQWGGSLGSVVPDYDQREALLRKIVKPHELKKFMELQREADEEYLKYKKRKNGTLIDSDKKKVQQNLRIISGTAAGKKLLSYIGPQTRPMMEKVRGAIFNMILSQAGTENTLPENARWLDLFAGTGSVGLEALSRGVGTCHFIEMCPKTTSAILSKNIDACGFRSKTIIHTCKAEDFLTKATTLPRFVGGAFDYISMCPPYLLVSYPQLFDLLGRSCLLHSGSIVFVEYPKQLAHQIPKTLGPLVQIKDRKYGRTWMAVYGPGSDDGDE